MPSTAALSREGVKSSMPYVLTYCEGQSKRQFHKSDKDESQLFLHNVEMDKNGGPNSLKAWREFRGLSQEALGELVGTNGSQISMLETGERGLSAKWLRKLAVVLDTSPGAILDRDPLDPDSDVTDLWASIPGLNRPRARRILEQFKDGTND